MSDPQKKFNAAARKRKKDLDKALLGQFDCSFGISLYNAAKIKDLLTWGADPNVQTLLGNTPLILAVKYANYNATDTLKILIEAGADIEHTNRLGNTARHYAARALDPELLNILNAALKKKEPAAKPPKPKKGGDDIFLLPPSP